MPSHTISVLVENEFGVLARVAGLFSSRGFNIESLTVNEDPLDPTVSRIVLVATGEQVSAALLAIRLQSMGHRTVSFLAFQMNLTTDSNHGRKVYPNLARALVLTGVDQLWRADIT